MLIRFELNFCKAIIIKQVKQYLIYYFLIQYSAFLDKHLILKMKLIFYFIFLFLGLIKTTSRKLDRENQPEHILEVSLLEFYSSSSLFLSFPDDFIELCLVNSVSAPFLYANSFQQWTRSNSTGRQIDPSKDKKDNDP